MGALSAGDVWGSTYQARFTAGAYLSTERFLDTEADGTTSNDFATFSSRMYMKVTELGSEKLDVVADLRDKNDFFDKLDAERLQLTPSNTFQARQLSVSYPNAGYTYYGSFGRFPVSDAGSVSVDGAEVGYRFTPFLRASLFGGFNPKLPDQTSLTFNQDATVFGAYSLYQPKSEDWRRTFYMSNAAVGETITGTFTRFYLFNNTIYQWEAPNQLYSILYLDFIPRLFIQTALISYHQQITPKVTGTANLTAIDAIEYTRTRGILEILPPSPYKELNFNVRQKIRDTFSMDYNLAYGIRDVDSESKTEYSLGPVFSQFISRHFTASGLLGYRRNFVSYDNFVKGNLGWFSAQWEINLDAEYGTRLEQSGNLYHPLVWEVAVARYLSKELYATVSVQDATTERVDIFSTFFKVGYRFGSKAVAPLRDGAPPRGRL